MPKAIVTGSDETGYIDESTPVDPTLLAAVAGDMAPMFDGRPTSKSVFLLEMAGIKASMRTWYDKQPDQVLREASAYSARLTELWTELRLMESALDGREWQQMRTMQVQPVLDEIDRQYKFGQSRIALMRQEMDMLRAT